MIFVDREINKEPCQIDTIKAMFTKWWIMHYQQDKTETHFENVVKEYTDFIATGMDYLDLGWIVWVCVINSHFALSDLYSDPTRDGFEESLSNAELSQNHLETAKGILDSFEDHYDAEKAAWIFYEVGIYRNGGISCPYTKSFQYRPIGFTPCDNDYKFAAELIDKAVELWEEDNTPEEFWCLIHRAWAFSSIKNHDDLENQIYNYRHAVWEYIFAIEMYDQQLNVQCINPIFENFLKLIFNINDLYYDLEKWKQTEEYKTAIELIDKFKNSEISTIPNAIEMIDKFEQLLS